jgi:hypothetical protein
MLRFIIGLIQHHRVALFGSKISAALHDLGLNVVRLQGPDFTAKCEAAYGQTSPHETAALMLAATFPRLRTEDGILLNLIKKSLYQKPNS